MTDSGTAAAPRALGPGERRRMAAGLVVFAAAGAVAVSALRHGTHGSSEISPTARFLFACAVVLGVCHATAALFRRFGQPGVVGEILSGLILGPSVLGAVWPHAEKTVFPASVIGPLGLAAQLGLLMFMFLVGSELRFDRVRARTAAGSVLGAMGLPLAAGLAIAATAAGTLTGPAGHRAASIVFFGLAVSITSLTALARILDERGLTATDVGSSALATAALGDGVAWMGFALILALSGVGGFQSPWVTPSLTLGLVAATFLAVKPALAAVERRAAGNSSMLLTSLIVGTVGYATLTEAIGLHAAFGAFLFGTALPRGSRQVEMVDRQLSGFVVTVMLPLFFAQIGLSTSAALLGSHGDGWALLALVLVAAAATKVVGAGAGARLTGMGTRDALRFGILMNCRGVTELIAASIGLKAGLVSPTGFAILVLVALITTAATTPLFQLATSARAPVPVPVPVLAPVPVLVPAIDSEKEIPL
jgi:Kef-type K+ transport system membrane component KefB